jgi:hypothetical protein
MAWRDRIEDLGFNLRDLSVSRRLSVVEYDNRRVVDRVAELGSEVIRLGRELQALQEKGRG